MAVTFGGHFPPFKALAKRHKCRGHHPAVRNVCHAAALGLTRHRRLVLKSILRTGLLGKLRKVRLIEGEMPDGGMINGAPKAAG